MPMVQATPLCQTLVSVLIKALNEETKIERCLVSAIAETRNLNGEVILVDSLSEDDTVKIASKFAEVKIVQFLAVSDRGCGAATQLGYQFARGEFIYVLDGDMVLEPGFLAKALLFLQQNPEFAGVGGRLVDTHIRTESDARRVAVSMSLIDNQLVSELGGGGLYRRSAIESVQYLSHRWLPACEEAELGARLSANGWKLMRLPNIAVRHTGHQESELGSLVRLWRSQRAQAPGMLIRASLTHPWGNEIRRKFWYLFVAPMIHFAAALLGFACWQRGQASLMLGFACFDMALLSALWVALAFKNRSVKRASLSLLTWHWYSIASLLGFIRGLPDPKFPIAAKELTPLNCYVA